MICIESGSGRRGAKLRIRIHRTCVLKTSSNVPTHVQHLQFLFLAGRRPAVLFDGVGSRGGWQALLRAGNDHEEVVERRGGAGLFPQVRQELLTHPEFQIHPVFPAGRGSIS